MASVNKVILVGNLGADPEIRYAPSGSAICNMRLATTRNWKDKASGERREETEWHRVVLYDRLAEIAGEYLKKGRSIYVEGRLQTRKWTDKDGNDRYTTEVVGNEMQMLGGREGGGGGGGGGGDDYARESGGGRSAARGGGGGGAGQAGRGGAGTGGGDRGAKESPGFDDMDDDIPF